VWPFRSGQLNSIVDDYLKTPEFDKLKTDLLRLRMATSFPMGT
jgi:hypothetical protein